MTKLSLKCWNCHSHEIELPEKKIDKFLERCHKGKFVCHCGSRIELIDRSDKSELDFKGFECSNKHLVIVGLFGKPGKLSVRSQDGNENIDGVIKDIPAVPCPKCQELLNACNNTKLSYPKMPAFKTRMKLGDFWDKQKTPEPKIGTYDENAADPENPFRPKYNQTEFEVRNKERLKQIRKKRNIPLDKTPGTPID